MSEPVVQAHGPDCPCPRCRGFEPGNQIGARHGAHAVLQLAPRAAEVADFLRDAMGAAYSPRYEIIIQSAGPIGARFEKALLALVEAGAADLSDLDARARGWARLWFSVLDKLGLSPLAASKQGLNLALGQDVAQRALERHLHDRETGGEAS